MPQILVLTLSLFTDSAGTTETLYATTGKEYLGAGAPGIVLPIIQDFASIDLTAFGSGQTFGEITIAPGSVTLANPAGALDYLLTLGGGTATLDLLDSETTAWSDRQTMLIADVDHIDDSISTGILTVQLSDGRAAAEALFEATTYAGTNSGATGLQGTPSDLEGKPIVNCLGDAFQCPVPFVNAPAQIVQLDKIRINAITAIYDGLVAITAGTKKTTLANLIAATPTAGHYDYYLGDDAGGGNDGAYAMIATTPKYQVTADIQGQARGGTFRGLAGDLFKEIIEQRIGGTTDAANIAAINAAMPYALGMWLDQSIANRDVLTRIAQSIVGFWGRDKLGVYRLYQLQDPAGMTSVASFEPILPLEAVPSTTGDIVAFSRPQITQQPADSTSAIVNPSVPVSDITVTYAPNGVVTNLGFDTASDPTVRMNAAQASLSAKPTTPCTNWIKKYPLSQPFSLDTWHATKAGAVTVADILRALFNVEGRGVYQAVLPLNSSVVEAVDLATCITIKFPRYGFDAGKKAFVLDMKYRGFSPQADAGQTVTCNVLV